MTKQSSFTCHKLIYFADKEAEHSSPSSSLAQEAAMKSMAMKSKSQVPTSQIRTTWLDCPVHWQITEKHLVNRILYTDQAKHGSPVCFPLLSSMTSDGFTTDAEPENFIIKI